ncbi:molybdopterin molybdotransferase MoeA [Pseudonocardia sp. 73-21]|uniref:molybdopterin molybdotransferase MoeA n=1 Tax=Pseudonocardia sp. 73-21 TaxID=1895809 RepID=UPI000962AE71|nr:molybdopterin molybdotransferase MoeA [Pseudonocardia sp. 73-21]OJY52839.1 MAG: hypothetical protein BGP03_10625 [Pseudonocardia sp. 73-21]
MAESPRLTGSPCPTGSRPPGVEAARAAWLTACTAAGCANLLPAETIGIGDAIGRLTATPVWARWSVPADPVAAMDGIAIRALDAIPDPADPPVSLVLAPDRYDVVDTGDLLPAGRDTVVMREQVANHRDETVEIPASACAPGTHVRQVGEDVRVGELLLPAHHRLRPVDVALVASTGHTTIDVHTRPAVAIIPTGDEIRPIGTDLAPGEILDTNSLLLAGILRENGCEVRVLPIEPDRAERIANAARAAARTAELVLIIAGSSAGRDDHTADVLRTLGEVVVHGVAVKPGHPVVLAVLRGDRAVPVIGVPGYPVSAALTVELFALPLLAGLHARPAPRRPTIPAHVAVHVEPEEIDRYLLVTLRESDRATVPTTELSRRGAGALSALARADGLLHLAAGDGLRAGDLVTVGLMRGARERAPRPGRARTDVDPGFVTDPGEQAATTAV